MTPRLLGMGWHWQKARKPYKCDWCKKTIPLGARYGKYTSMKNWDGYEAGRTYRICQTCNNETKKDS